MSAAPGRAGASFASFAAALLDPGHPVPDGLTVWNGSDPAVRLAVHRNNVVSSLVDALADTFPVVQQLVGPDFFRALAALFVRQQPPRTPVLMHYGQAFPAFIAAFPPAGGLPYLADMARLEMARVLAFHAADANPVPAAMVSQALSSGDRMGALRLQLQPSLATLASRHAVVTLWAAHQLAAAADDMAPVDIDLPESALVLRAGFQVLVLAAPAGAVDFVDAVQAGCALGPAAARALAAAPGFDLGVTLATLLQHGALQTIGLPPEGPACTAAGVA